MIEREKTTEASDFAQRGVVTLQHMLDGDTLRLAAEYVNLRLIGGAIPPEADQPGRHALYADPLAESMFALITPGVTEIVDTHVRPTYAYLRVYRAGSELRPHTDRSACELTLTLPVAGQGAALSWPIEGTDLAGDEFSAAPEPGDGVLMRGQQVRHWRSTLTQGWLACVFLHWVAADADRSLWYDGRPMLGIAIRPSAKT